MSDLRIEDVWRTYLMEGLHDGYWYENKRFRSISRAIPSDPRCRICYYPFGGIGGSIVRHTLGLAPSNLNPHLCNICEQFAEKYRGGAEVEMSVLFADVRGSTGLARSMSPSTYSQLINRFYKATTKVLFQANAMVEKIIGDEVTGLFVPGFSGKDHAAVAFRSAQDILRVTGHTDGVPWIPLGIGVHSGVAFVGSVETGGGRVDISALGDAVNTGSRLASQAAAGEVILSEETRTRAGLSADGIDARRLQLKGYSEPLNAWAWSAIPEEAGPAV